jgi:predicted RNA-binding Zn-ribbon protein involved in translation (DUF1610 family)
MKIGDLVRVKQGDASGCIGAAGAGATQMTKLTNSATRVKLGFQCPECSAVRINCLPRQPHDPYLYQCQECGCQWTGLMRKW